MENNCRSPQKIALLTLWYSRHILPAFDKLIDMETNYNFDSDHRCSPLFDGRIQGLFQACYP